MGKILKLLAIVVSGTTILTACNANQQTQLPEANEEALPEEEFIEELPPEENWDYDDGFESDEYIEDFDEEYRDEPEEDIANQEHDAEGRAMPEDNDAIGTWCTEGYDEDNNFAMSYMLELKEDGTALCTGYRNRDAGTYEAQGQYAIITFDKCEYDQPGEGYVPQDGAGYTVEMEIQGNEAEIKVSGDYLDTNLSDGKMFRSGGYVRGTQDSKDVADGTYITGEQYTGSISEDGKMLTINAGLSHYDNNWQLIPDYPKEEYRFPISEKCKCVIYQETAEEDSVTRHIGFINDFLAGNSGLPITLSVKNGELTGIEFSS